MQILEHRLSRRSALIAGAAVLTSHAMPAAADQDVLGAIERRYGGRLGVFALDLQTGRTLAHRADQRFKLQSTFKGLLAALVLADVARGAERLEAIVSFTQADLLPASPITTAAVARGQMTVGELCEAIMYRSDNTAANLLMARRGGPNGLTSFLRGLGDKVTRVDSYEGQMKGRPASFDTTSPRAIVETARRLLLGNTLSPLAREQLSRWMVGNVVGRARLRAAFPPDWRSGDRTGTSDGVCNDYAFAERPARAPLFMSAYYAAPGMPLSDQEAVLRAVGQTIVKWQQV